VRTLADPDVRRKLEEISRRSAGHAAVEMEEPPPLRAITISFPPDLVGNHGSFPATKRRFSFAQEGDGRYNLVLASWIY
jgi:hypothetical protein